MATYIEEFESAISLVCGARRDLQRVNRNNPLLSYNGNPSLSYIGLAEVGFDPNSKYYEKYVRPHLRSPDGQLCLWDWVYPNQFEAILMGLKKYYNDLSAAIRTEISERGLDKSVGIYQR